MALSTGPGAAELSRQLEAKKLSAEEFAVDLVARERLCSHLNAISNFDADLLIRQARSADAKRSQGLAKSLCGVPLIAKDNINTVAFPTTGGTTALLHHTPEKNADVINSVEEAGGIIGAKSGMHELAFGITCNNAVTGAIRNPHDPDAIPGGSSGGTASAVSANLFPAGLGTDTGASVRLPAALCGIVGFRPTVGRYSGEGIIPISHTRDTVGPMSHHVEDIALIDSVLTGTAVTSTKKQLSDVVLGVPKEVFFDNLEPDVSKAVQDTLDTLQRAGVSLVEVSLSSIWPLNEATGFPIALFEVMQDLPAYLKEHAPDVSFDELVSKIKSADVAGIIASQQGEEAIPKPVYEAAINEHRPAMQAIYNDVFKTHGLTALAFPTSPVRACRIGEDDTLSLNGHSVPTFPTYIRNTDLGSNIGVPGISLPCPDVSGLPVGIEFDGLAGADHELISLALSIEQALTR